MRLIGPKRCPFGWNITPNIALLLKIAGEFGVDVVISGPLQSDDGERMIGSLFIIEAPDRAAVEAYANADPFTRTGVWEDIRIHRFFRRKG